MRTAVLAFGNFALDLAQCNLFDSDMEVKQIAPMLERTKEMLISGLMDWPGLA